jgi:hypothetical protein
VQTKHEAFHAMLFIEQVAQGHISQQKFTGKYITL